MVVRGAPPTEQKFEGEIKEGFIKVGAFFKRSKRAETIAWGAQHNGKLTDGRFCCLERLSFSIVLSPEDCCFPVNIC